MKRLFIILALSLSASATTRLVSTTGADSGDCSSSPCLTATYAESQSSAGDTISFAAGTYRLAVGHSSTSGSIAAKDNQTFTGPSCTPTVGPTQCTAIISGGIVLTGWSSVDGNGNYHVSGQTQAGTVIGGCDAANVAGGGWPGCSYPEDVFLDGSPLVHIPDAVSISSFTGTSGTLTFATKVNTNEGNALVAGSTVTLSGFTAPNTGLNGQTVTVISTGLSGSQFEAAVTGSGYASGTGAGTVTNVQATLVSGQFYFDYTNHIIYIHDNPSGHTLETSVLQTMFATSNGLALNVNGVTIQNLTITEFATPTKTGTIDPGLGIAGADPTKNLNWTVQNCYLTLNHGNAIRAAFGLTVLNNVITQNGVMGIGGGFGGAGVGFPSNFLVQGNTITFNNYSHLDPGQGSGGFKLGDASGVTVKNNISSNNIGKGIHFDDLSYSNTIDGNTVEHNTDACCSNTDGITSEIGAGTTVIRNNVSRFNGEGGLFTPNNQITATSSPGNDIYCNVMEVANVARESTWNVNAGNRVFNGTQIIVTGNSVHHNTVIFDAGATATTGFQLTDTAHQPNFFASNSVPYANTYHMNPVTGAVFKYDNNSSGSNTSKTFANYQLSTGTPPTGINLGPDVAATGGSIDTVNTSGWPLVSITAPLDQANFSNSVAVTSTASDGSGITKVEFYLDWVLQTTVNNPGPYNATVSNLVAGSHTLAAMAYSTAGVRNCNAVTVNNIPLITTPNTLLSGPRLSGVRVSN